MKYHASSNIFKYSWDQVSCAFWNRYPNPYSTHVISEDTISRKVDGGKLITHRLITKASRVPAVGKIFLSGEKRNVCVLEESIVDLKTKTITTYTTNIGLNKVATVDEKCTYSQAAENRGWTECRREAWVYGQSFRLSNTLHSLVLKIFQKHIGNTIRGYEHVLQNMVPNASVVQQEKALKERINHSKEKFKESAKKAKERAELKIKMPLN